METYRLAVCEDEDRVRKDLLIPLRRNTGGRGDRV